MMKRLRLAGLLGVLSVLLAVQFILAKGCSVGPLTLYRGNVRSLVMGVPCSDQHLSCSPNVSWEYKITVNEPWKNLTSFGRHRHLHEVYFLKELLPDTHYYVRAFLSPPGCYTSIKEAWTCPNLPPPVSSLRSTSAGPGWLSMRWTRPTENCKSTLIFLVRYNVEGLPLGPPKTFGIMDAQGGYAITSSFHPCPNQDSEFCVLFTDRVQPGHKHTVEVRTKRYDMDDNAVAEPQTVTVLADTRNIESEEKENKKERTQLTGEEVKHVMEITEDGIVLPLWSLILVGGILFIMSLTDVVCLAKSCRKDNSGSSNKICARTNIGEFPSILKVSVPNIYDYPRLPQGKPNSLLS